MADFQPQSGHSAAPEQVSATRVTQWVGALVSVVLLVGAVYWGYSIVVRDVSGIPVVRAAQGPLRVQPDDPGGQPADNQGLAVNDVVGVGSASTPADQLVLAPEPVELAEEDRPLGQMPIVTAGETGTLDLDGSDGSAVDLAESLIANQAEVGEVAAGDEAILLAVLEATGTEGETTVLDQIRIPPLRPSTDTTPAALAERVGSVTQDVDPDTVPDGERLVQLGAFDSEAVARSEWDRMKKLFPGYLEDKSRVIQQATSGGRVFYRLRALGFSDIEDARRFCAAFKARNVDCVPVLVR